MSPWSGQSIPAERRPAASSRSSRDITPPPGSAPTDRCSRRPGRTAHSLSTSRYAREGCSARDRPRRRPRPARGEAARTSQGAASSASPYGRDRGGRIGSARVTADLVDPRAPAPRRASRRAPHGDVCAGRVLSPERAIAGWSCSWTAGRTLPTHGGCRGSTCRAARAGDLPGRLLGARSTIPPRAGRSRVAPGGAARERHASGRSLARSTSARTRRRPPEPAASRSAWRRSSPTWGCSAPSSTRCAPRPTSAGSA